MRPLPISLAIVALWLAMIAAGLTLILREPWLGLDLVAGPGGEVLVRGVDGPARGAVSPGDRILALREPGGTWLEISAADLNREPTYLHTYVQLDEFFARQGRIHELLRRPQVELQRDAQPALTLVPATRRALRSVPGHVWLQFLFAAIVLTVAGASLAQAPADLTARLLSGMSLGYVNCFCAHAVYSARELAMSGEWFRFLIGMDHASALALCGGFGACVLWNFPRPLRPAAGGWALLALGVGLAVLGELRIAKTITFGFRLPLMTMIAMTIVLPGVQWRRAKDRPLHRAMLRWWMLPWIVGIGLYTALMMIPSALGGDPAANQTLGWGFLTFVFVGLGLGLARFRLFYLNPANLWVWSITGLVCAVLVIALYGVLRDQWLASCIGIAVAGVLYFPVRELLWRWKPHERARLEVVLSLIARRAVGTASLASLTRSWRETLDEVFRPIEIRVQAADNDAVRLLDGETLDAAIRGPGGGLRLLRPFDGRGLFSPQDAALAQTIGALYAALAAYWQAHENGVREEREHLTRLIGDRLRPKLRELCTRAHAPESAALLEQAATRLDSILAVLATRPCALDDAATAWRVQFIDACRAAGVDGEVRCYVPLRGPELSEYQMIAATRFVQETAANIVRHSAAAAARLTIRYAMGRLDLIAEDDGHADLDTLQQGRGMRGLMDRSHGLGGTLELATSAMGGLALHLSFPLESFALPDEAARSDARGEGQSSVPRSGDTSSLGAA